MSIEFSKATATERANFAAILKAHDATLCTCGAPIAIEGCYSGIGMTEDGTEFSAISVACAACGADVIALSSWATELDTVSDFLTALETEWGREEA